MRRIVRDYVVAAIDRARPQLEQFIARHLECPESVPLTAASSASQRAPLLSAPSAARLREAAVARMPSANGVPAKPNSLANLSELKR